MGAPFDNQAAAYNRWYATPLGRLVDTVEKQAIFDLTPEVRGRRVLEVGCGTGNFSLASARRGAEVVGLDCSGSMLARAQDKAGRQGLAITWVRGLASGLPFADGSFDGLMCILALDFMADREMALQEMVRVLSPGGFLAVAVLNRFSLWTLKRVIRAWLKPSLWREVRFLTPKELGRLLSGRQELVNIRTRQAVYFPPWKNRRLVRYYPYLEKLGKKLNLSTGAFLAASARKKSITEAKR
ncbi:MAG: class I SAM-dependent methyltransferase [Syntrophobacterales bacterium]|jgi:ubiquinone/menaquinone biosynthesis C-methylase UbiE|nr:class I SAM-dependent methyltransferase [Syntrophobacterales bacterium]